MEASENFFFHCKSLLHPSNFGHLRRKKHRTFNFQQKIHYLPSRNRIFDDFSTPTRAIHLVFFKMNVHYNRTRAHKRSKFASRTLLGSSTIFIFHKHPRFAHLSPIKNHFSEPRNTKYQLRRFKMAAFCFGVYDTVFSSTINIHPRHSRSHFALCLPSSCVVVAPVT